MQPLTGRGSSGAHFTTSTEGYIFDRQALYRGRHLQRLVSQSTVRTEDDINANTLAHLLSPSLPRTWHAVSLSPLARRRRRTRVAAVIDHTMAAKAVCSIFVFHIRGGDRYIPSLHALQYGRKRSPRDRSHNRVKPSRADFGAVSYGWS
jgi:hypothetical protein